MTMQKKLVTALAAVFVSFGAQADLVQTIDLFSTDQAKLTDSTVGGGGLFSQVGSDLDTTIIGGYRDIGVELISSSYGNDAYIQVAGGALSFSSGSTAGAQGLIRWDGSTEATSFGMPAMGLAASFNPVGTSFELLTISSDFGYKFILEAYTSATQYSRVELTAHQVSPPELPDGVSSLIPLLGFLQCGFDAGGVTVTCGSDGAVNWANVKALQAIINPNGGTVNLDLTLNQVTAVPEPGTLVLAGLGLLGLGAMRRRKQA